MCGDGEDKGSSHDLDDLMNAAHFRAKTGKGIALGGAFDSLKRRLKGRQIGAFEVTRSGSEPEPDPAPAIEAPVVDESGFPTQVRLTDESRGNIERAPDGTRFFCMLENDGTTHCAAGHGAALNDAEKSVIGGEVLDPIRPGVGGTGHQQLAQKIGLGFNEETAVQGFVEDDEGFGISIAKEGPCARDYKYNSAFNLKLNDDWDRALPEEAQQRVQEGIEQAFPACHLDNA